jgi:hypothetical protein
VIEWRELAPTVDVTSATFHRFLGYPAGVAPTDRALELAADAQAWYATHGRPWIYARQLGHVAVDEAGIVLEDTRFSARRLGKLLRTTSAHGAVLVAVSAGPELEEEAGARWRDEKPDEYFFLETLGSVVVEHLLMQAGARLCAWAEPEGLTVLPHDSPGHAGWNVAEQAALLSLARRTQVVAWPGPLEALDSGALRPKKSGTGVFGITRHDTNGLRASMTVPCHNCPAAACDYRRAPYRHSSPSPSASPR